ncbi:MAG: YIP1 family protein [Saccharofermentanales bacterium]
MQIALDGKLRGQLKFALHLLTHPFDGFWDMKHEKKGSLAVSLSFVALWILTNILEKQQMGYLFNSSYGVPVRAGSEIISILVIFGLFVVANWSVTTLMDGKGTARDITMLFGYSALPIFLIRVPVILFSKTATYGEGAYINFLFTFSMIWFMVLLFFGMITIHEYTLGKGIFTALITMLAMGIIVFISVILWNLLMQMINFLAALYKELSLRL